jgi:type VI secretion system protein VasG
MRHSWLPPFCTSSVVTNAELSSSHLATPPDVEDSQRRIEALQTDPEIIAREAAIGIDTADRQSSAESDLNVEAERLTSSQSA